MIFAIISLTNKWCKKCVRECLCLFTKAPAALDQTLTAPVPAVSGRGVITQEVIEPSAFVVEFRGRMTSGGEAKNGNYLDKFVYHYSWKGANWR